MSNTASQDPPQIETALQPRPVSIEPINWPDECGGEVCFVGRTRCETHREYGPLEQLEYEAFAPMVQKLMRRLAEDAAARFGCRCIRMVHATGVVMPGEASVVIQVAAPHRADAFEACRYLIDTLKRELPIWKREIWQRGDTFVDGCCARPPEVTDDGQERDHA